MADYSMQSDRESTTRGYGGTGPVEEEVSHQRGIRGPGATVSANVLSYLELQTNLIELALKEMSELENGIHPILRETGEKNGGDQGDEDSPEMSKVTRLIDQNNRQIRNLTNYIRSIKSRVNL